MAQFKLFVPLLVVLCVIVPLVQAVKFDYCGSNDYAVKVTGVKITPNPVKKGKPATFTISATTNETINGGKLRVDVKYFGIPVYGEYHDLCEETSCPVSGDFVVSHSQELPPFTPPGLYSLTMKMLGEKDAELTCITFGFHIGFIASDSDI